MRKVFAIILLCLSAVAEKPTMKEGDLNANVNASNESDVKAGDENRAQRRALNPIVAPQVGSPANENAPKKNVSKAVKICGPKEVLAV